MSSDTMRASGFKFRVLDAMDAPHQGRILRLRLQAGEAPSIRDLKGAEMRAVAPDGRSCRVRIIDFAVSGGKPSDERLARTGRVDVQVEELAGDGGVGLRWELSPQ